MIDIIIGLLIVTLGFLVARYTAWHLRRVNRWWKIQVGKKETAGEKKFFDILSLIVGVFIVFLTIAACIFIVLRLFNIV